MSVLDYIRAGDRVTIQVYAGMGRHGAEYRPKTGRAVMRGPGGWVLNMGGRYGTPGIASEGNIVRAPAAQQRMRSGQAGRAEAENPMGCCVVPLAANCGDMDMNTGTDTGGREMQMASNPELLVVENPRRRRRSRRSRGRNPKIRGRVGKKYVTWNQFVKLKMKGFKGRRGKLGSRLKKIARMWRRTPKKHGREKLRCVRGRVRASNRRRRRSRRR